MRAKNRWSRDSVLRSSGAWAAALALLAGCPAEGPGPGTLQTQYIGTSGYFTTTPYAGYYSYGSGSSSTTPGFAPPVISFATLSCVDDVLSAYIETTNWTADGLLFLQDTTAQAPQPAENHTVLSFEFGANGKWDHLRRDLPVEGYDPDVATGFRCADLPSLTWAVEVMDLSGQPADCVVLGQDPVGWTIGAYDGEREPDFPSLDCREGGI